LTRLDNNEDALQKRKGNPMQTTPLLQETKVDCLNGVKETVYKLSDEDLSVLSSQLMLLVKRQLTQCESEKDCPDTDYDQGLLQRLDYPDR
jgi:hypothetical protein